jgi:glycosyltransferase involved in cell wall biosynthesis
MSFNDNDKYSIIHKKWLNIYLKSNYGAQKLIKPNFTLLQICFINIRAIFFMNFIKRAEEVFVLSEFSKKEKKDLFNINAIVLRGALTKVFPYNYDKHKNIKTIKFLMVGRLDKNKRIDILLKIFYELISDTDLNLELDIIGTGSELTILKNLCSSLKIDKFVNFHGFICDKDLENFYHKSHIFISLDWADYKLTMFEALNYSCFVIVTKETELTSEIERSKRVFKTELESNSIKLILAEILVLRSSYKFSNEILEPFLWSNYFNQTLERIKN